MLHAFPPPPPTAYIHLDLRGIGGRASGDRDWRAGSKVSETRGKGAGMRWGKLSEREKGCIGHRDQEAKGTAVGKGGRVLMERGDEK